MKRVYIFSSKTCATIAIVSILPFFSSCRIRQEQPVNHAKWLIRTWMNKTTKGNVYENWIRLSQVELFGKSYRIRGTDIVLLETMRLVQVKDSLYYIPTVTDQNNAQSVRFAGTAISGQQLTFENPHHDFPQTIRYSKITKDSLVAEISGSKNGQLRRVAFEMHRLN